MAAEELLRRHADGGGRLARAEAEGAAAPPVLRTALLTCMDARIDPSTLFGLRPGEVHVLRNAGGIVTDDVVRSIVISQRKLGTRDVLVVQHSGCGLSTFTDDAFGDELAREVGTRPSWRALTFDDPAASVRDGLTRLRRDPFLHPDTTVRGFVLDIASFDVDEVLVDEQPGSSAAD